MTLTSLNQDYAGYQPDDFAVWDTLFTRQMELLKRHAFADHAACVLETGLNRNEIPEFSRLSPLLTDLCGWKICMVPGLIPTGDFFDLLAHKQFCSSAWLRSMDKLDYLPEPDMFHDIFGHIPALAIPRYADFMQKVGELALEMNNDPLVLEMLDRFYWFTIEFGLIREKGELKAYGAGLLSSFEEAAFSTSDKPVQHEFSVTNIVSHPFRNDTIQSEYYVIQSFEQLFGCLGELGDLCAMVKAGRIAPNELSLN